MTISFKWEYLSYGGMKITMEFKDLLNKCGLNKNALSSMQCGGSIPRADNLAKIADYLGCSVDYLLGRTDDTELHQK